MATVWRVTVGRFTTVVPVQCDKALLPGDKFSSGPIITSWVWDKAVVHACAAKTIILDKIYYWKYIYIFNDNASKKKKSMYTEGFSITLNFRIFLN